MPTATDTSQDNPQFADSVCQQQFSQFLGDNPSFRGSNGATITTAGLDAFAQTHSSCTDWVNRNRMALVTMNQAITPVSPAPSPSPSPSPQTAGSQLQPAPQTWFTTPVKVALGAAAVVGVAALVVAIVRSRR